MLPRQVQSYLARTHSSGLLQTLVLMTHHAFLSHLDFFGAVRENDYVPQYKDESNGMCNRPFQ